MSFKLLIFIPLILDDYFSCGHAYFRWNDFFQHIGKGERSGSSRSSKCSSLSPQDPEQLIYPFFFASSSLFFSAMSRILFVAPLNPDSIHSGFSRVDGRVPFTFRLTSTRD